MGRSDKNVLPKNPSSAQNTKDDSIDWNVPLLVNSTLKEPLEVCTALS